MFRKFENTIRSQSSKNILMSENLSGSQVNVDFEEINQRYPPQRPKLNNILKKRLVSFRKLPIIKSSTKMMQAT